MPVNIYETPVTPSVDLDSDVIVFVPGYAVKGPEEPTLVNSSNFTALFGDAPYVFKASQEDTAIPKNNVLAGKQEKSWKFVKAITDAGLTVLFKRFKSENAVTPQTSNAFKILDGTKETGIVFYAKSKYFGSYYSGISVEFLPKTNGVTSVTVKNGVKTLESYNVSFDPEASNFICNTDFSNIELFIKDSEGNDLGSLDDSDIAKYISEKVTTSGVAPTLYATGIDTLVAEATEDEFDINDFSEAINDGSIFKEILDTDRYTVVYITSGGYFVSKEVAGKMMDIAYQLKSIALVDLPNEVKTIEDFLSYQDVLANIPVSNVLAKSKGAQLIGCDTFSSDSKRIVVGDSLGYLTALGANIQNGIPAWVPVANTSQGAVSLGCATTRSVNKELADEMAFGEVGCSVNPVVYKKNIGYVIMGNRTLYPNSGVLGPQSFLNCQIVVNSVERSARTAASDLTLVETNSETAFKKFKNAVGKTCDKMLVNGDGLNSYTINKLPKTKPATLDIAIDLVVVEGIETFNIHLQYSIALD